MPPLVPSFMLPKWLQEAPWWLKAMLLGPAMAVGAVLGIVVHAILINLGAGNQHLSTAEGGFEPWLIWPIAVIGLFLFAGIAGLVYLGVGLGADVELDDDEEHEGETGLLEI
ncbi:MAG TPA: hypothetical protein QGF05_13075 [Dehalococcoidia bacterium]|nr:hypothetical protein [Dehalococcoidia bacterium]